MKTFERGVYTYGQTANGYYKLSINEFVTITKEEYEQAKAVEVVKPVEQAKPLFESEQAKQVFLKEFAEDTWRILVG